jgi:hypothetical protein
MDAKNKASPTFTWMPKTRPALPLPGVKVQVQPYHHLDAKNKASTNFTWILEISPALLHLGSVDKVSSIITWI